MSILGPDGRPARGRAPAQSAMLRGGWPSIYEAANRADFRGYFYLPTLDPGEQLDSMTRSAISERADFLYKNVGAVTMLIDRISLAESGTGIWPKWVTGAEDYDRAATDAYHFTNHDPRFFSADGHNDAYSVQYAIRRCNALYGDAFGQLLRPAPGAVFPQMHLIPGWQCDNDGTEKPESGWRDGLRASPLNRALEYKFVSGTGKGRSVVPALAEDVLHFHDPFLPGQRRGVSCLAPVAKKLFRREDVQRAIANGTLARERLGFAIESSTDEAGPKIDFGGEKESIENGDGSSYTVHKLFGEGTSEEIEIPALPPGMKIAPVESNRPGTAVMEFQNSILTECAWARKYPAEFVFFHAGIGQGTVARAVQLAAGEVIVSSREFQMKPQFHNRWAVYWIWQLISTGYFDRLKIAVPGNWWQYKSVMPALPTVDVGREGALHDNRVATGRESIEAYHGMSGDDASDVEDENLAARKRRYRKLKALNDYIVGEGFAPLTYDEIWSRSINVPMSPAAPTETSPSKEKDEE